MSAATAPGRLEPGNPRPSHILKLAAAAVFVGIGAGIAGIAIILVIHGATWIAFGEVPHSGRTLLEIVEAAPPWRRVAALTGAGVIGAVGWFLLRRRGRAIVSDDAAAAGAAMPPMKTIADGLLQMAVIGFGGSAGRELAPRQLGALAAAWLSDRTGLSAEERRALIACGAGAGLAAVYGVPLGGAIFALEVVYKGMRVPVVIMAVATSAIAALVGSLVVPDTPLFALERMDAPPSLYVWALIVGPILGIGGAWFARSIAWVVGRRPTGARLLWIMPLTYLGVGLLAWPFPEIIGDGGPLSTESFDSALPLALLAVVIGVKALVTVGTYAAGTAGGTLTPSIAFGAALGALFGGIWSLWFPGTPVAAFAVVGAAAFLGAAIHAPLSALVLVIEFTGQSFDFYLPMMIAVAGALLVGRLIERRSITGAF